jgi:ferritin
MEELYKELHEHLEEEIEDAHEYIELAEDAEARGCKYLAIGLHEIAREEFSHAKFHRDYLISKGQHPHGEIEEKWHELKRMMFGELS